MKFLKSKPNTGPLRIALVTRRPYAGLRSFHRGLAFPLMSLLRQRGHEAVLFLEEGSSPGFEPPPELGVVFFPRKKAQETFLKLHSSKPFDIVHGLDRSALALAQNKRAHGFKVTFDAQSTQMNQLFSLMGMTSDHWTSLVSTGLALSYKFLSTYLKYDRQLLRLADGVFVGSQAQRNLLEWFYLYPPVKTHLLPLGTSTRPIPEDLSSQEIRKRWNLTTSGPILLFMTSMKQKREYQALLQAFQVLAIKKPTARLLVLGQGPETKSFERLMLDLALNQRVQFLGIDTLERTAEALVASDIIVNFQGATTGLEPSLLDAMSLGRVVIGSDVSPWADWIRQGTDGFALKMTHQSELSSIFLELAQRPELRQQMGLHAKQRIEELLHPDALAKKIEAAFRGVLHRRSQPAVASL